MQELRYILVALGGIAIAALLIHGLWSNRKNRQAPIKEKPLGRMESKSRDRDSDAFDSDGIGQVRVVSSTLFLPSASSSSVTPPSPFLSTAKTPSSEITMSTRKTDRINPALSARNPTAT